MEQMAEEGTAPADEEDEKQRRKRVSPYFYPNMRALRFLGRDIAYGDISTRTKSISQICVLGTSSPGVPRICGSYSLVTHSSVG